MRTLKVQTNFAIGKEKYRDVKLHTPFATAIVDPDWPYTVAPGVERFVDADTKGRLSGFTRNRDGINQYKQCTPLTINELKKLPIDHAVGGYIFLWTVGPFLINGAAMDVIKAWGFEPVSIITWAKWKPATGFVGGDGKGYGGVGFWFLGNAEFCIVAKHPDWPSIRTGISSLIVAPKSRHSEKPSRVHEICEKRFPGPYLEIFGRKSRKGWIVLGDEAPDDGEDIQVSLADLI